MNGYAPRLGGKPYGSSSHGGGVRGEHGPDEWSGTCNRSKMMPEQDPFVRRMIILVVVELMGGRDSCIVERHNPTPAGRRRIRYRADVVFARGLLEAEAEIQPHARMLAGYPVQRIFVRSFAPAFFALLRRGLRTVHVIRNGP